MSNPLSTEVIRIEAPATRDIDEVLNAIDIVIKELNFQVSRLGTTVVAKTADEARYHRDLSQGYRMSSKWLRTLEKYQIGRLERRNKPDSVV